MCTLVCHMPLPMAALLLSHQPLPLVDSIMLVASRLHRPGLAQRAPSGGALA